jgi:hypothetical protein
LTDHAPYLSILRPDKNINGVFSAIESAVNRNKSRGIERRLKWYAKYEIIKTP